MSTIGKYEFSEQSPVKETEAKPSPLLLNQKKSVVGHKAISIVDPNPNNTKVANITLKKMSFISSIANLVGRRKLF